MRAGGDPSLGKVLVPRAPASNDLSLHQLRTPALEMGSPCRRPTHPFSLSWVPQLGASVRSRTESAYTHYRDRQMTTSGRVPSGADLCLALAARTGQRRLAAGPGGLQGGPEAWVFWADACSLGWRGRISRTTWDQENNPGRVCI